MIIWLASYPRSGNTFVRILLRQIYGIDTYSLYKDKELTDCPRLCEMAGHLPMDRSIETMAREDRRFIVKTHELPQDDYPALFLVRDGRDTLMSYAHYIVDYHSDGHGSNLERVMRSLILDPGYFGGWGAHTLAWSRRLAPTAIITFEEMAQSPDPRELVIRAMRQLGQSDPPPAAGLPAPLFSALRDIEPRLFREGRTGGWMGELPPELHTLFWRRHGEAMCAMGYGGEGVNRVIVDLAGELVVRQVELEEKQKKLESYLAEVEGKQRELELYQAELAARNEELKRKEEHIQALFGFFHGLGLRSAQSFLIRMALNRIKHPTKSLLIARPPKRLKIPRRYLQTASGAGRSWPAIAMVTPSFNQGRFIERTIRSIAGQEYPRLEYVVQDGASTDGTAGILEKLRGTLAHVESAADGGQPQAINRGFARTTGEIMAWLNSDDVLLPGALAYVAEYFSSQPTVDVVYGHRVMIDENDDDVGRWILPRRTHELLPWADYIPQETLFWRRRIWEKAGGRIDESFQYAMDWDLLMRFWKARAVFVRLPRFLAAFRIHPGQKSTAWHDLGLREMERVRREYHGRLVTQLEAEFRVQRFQLSLTLHTALHRAGVLRY